MKDKVLRKLLADQGIIRSDRDGIYASSASMDDAQSRIHALERTIRNLESKFEAINKHYGITVERPSCEYVVKEGA